MAFSRMQNMLLGIAVGDAFGAGYEFRYPKKADYEKRFEWKYLKHPKPESKHSPGMYTDDTQMSISIAECMLEEKSLSKEALLKHFRESYARDPVDGYGRRTLELLLNNAAEFVPSERNSAAMRSVPLGAIVDLNELVNAAYANAQATHNSLRSASSSLAVALMSRQAFARARMPFCQYALPFLQQYDADLCKYLKEVNRSKAPLDGKSGVPTDATETLGAVLYLLNNFPHPEDLLKNAIVLGGDTDSVASMALGIRMINHDIMELRPFLYERLTNHKYGRDYLLKLGRRLEKKFTNPTL